MVKGGWFDGRVLRVWEGGHKRPEMFYNSLMTKQLELDVLALPAQDRLYLMRLLLDSFVVFDEGSDEIEVGRNDTEYLLSLIHI